jgi:ankyrin repeat protein
MDKRAFIKSVRNWEFAAVKSAVASDPALSTYKDQIGKTALHHCSEINAAKTGLPVAASVKTARLLISAGADVNAVRIIMDEGEEFHARPLWYAVAWGKNLELARFLLDNGADPNGCMWAAVWDQDLRMAKLLHSRGAQIDPVSNDETPLLLAVKSNRAKLLDWLIDNGADINFQDSSGYSGLHHAIIRKYTAAQVKIVLDRGANPALRAKDGSTPASLAADQGRTKLVSLLKQHT